MTTVRSKSSLRPATAASRPLTPTGKPWVSPDGRYPRLHHTGTHVRRGRPAMQSPFRSDVSTPLQNRSSSQGGVPSHSHEKRSFTPSLSVSTPKSVHAGVPGQSPTQIGVDGSRRSTWHGFSSHPHSLMTQPVTGQITTTGWHWPPGVGQTSVQADPSGNGSHLHLPCAPPDGYLGFQSVSAHDQRPPLHRDRLRNPGGK